MKKDEEEGRKRNHVSTSGRNGAVCGESFHRREREERGREREKERIDCRREKGEEKGEEGGRGVSVPSQFKRSRFNTGRPEVDFEEVKYVN